MLKINLNSLSSKLFLLLFLTIASLAIPSIFVVYYNVLEISSKSEENSFTNTLSLIEENLKSNYVNLLSGQVSDVIVRRKYLNTLALLAKDSWEDSHGVFISQSAQLLPRWVNSLTDINSHLVIFKNGKPLTDSILYEIFSQNNKKSDLKEQKFTAMLNPANLPEDGTYLSFSISKDDIENTKNKSKPFPSLDMQKSHDLLKAGHRVPVLAYFLPIDKDITVMVASLLSDIKYESAQQLEFVAKSMQEKINTLAFFPKSILAIISGEGKLLAHRGAFSQNDIEFLPKELFTLNNSDRYIEFYYDNADDIADNPFLKTFGQSILRVSYFKSLGWYTVAAVPLEEIRASSNVLIKKLATIASVIILLCVFVTLIIAYRLTKPMRTLTSKVRDFGRVDIIKNISADANASSFSSICENLPTERKDEVGELATAFNALGGALDENIHNLLATKAVTERMQGELSAAREIQMNILPNKADMPSGQAFSVAAFLEAAKEIGGDLYDFFTLPNGRQVVVIGDVSGKGMGAALFMAMTVTLIRHTMTTGDNPHQALTLINKTLSKKNTSCMFVTLIIAVFSPDSGELIYANAGHCRPFLIHNNKIEELKYISGPMVGPLEEITYTVASIKLTSNSTCFFYTDGISEALDEEENIYGTERLMSILQQASTKTPQEIIDTVYADVQNFRKSAEQSDDITMLCFKYTE